MRKLGVGAIKGWVSKMSTKWCQTEQNSKINLNRIEDSREILPMKVEWKRKYAERERRKGEKRKREKDGLLRSDTATTHWRLPRHRSLDCWLAASLWSSLPDWSSVLHWSFLSPYIALLLLLFFGGAYSFGSGWLGLSNCGRKDLITVYKTQVEFLIKFVF